MGDGAVAGGSVTFQTCLYVVTAKWRVAPRFSRPEYAISARVVPAPSLQRHKVIQHGRNEFRNRGVDVHRPLQDGGRRLGIHGVENTMNNLVT